MNIVQITPGAGAMYCGLCFRDNALVSELRKMGHHVVMVPLYLPFTLDEADQSAGTPIFFSGINVYLDQKSGFFRRAPGWLHSLLASRPLLKWAAGKAARTRPQDLGEMTLSMLRGEAGNQARELDELIAWLKSQPPPDVICLSTALLLGMVHRLKSDLRAPVVCNLQGEDVFLDSLPEAHRALCWKTLASRAAETDLFLATSRYFGNLMSERLSLSPEKLRVVYNGINLDDYDDDAHYTIRVTNRASPPYLGYFARMCPDKGLDSLVDAYITLRQRDHVKDLKLRIGGGCGPSDRPFVDSLRRRLEENGLLGDVGFFPNPPRATKLAFLHSLSLFCVPSRYGEAFGLYVVEALAAGVPVVLPRKGAFPELVEATGGGSLCAADDPHALADALEQLLLDPDRARTLGAAGRGAVFDKFSSAAMARASVTAYEQVRDRNQIQTVSAALRTQSA